MPKSVSKNEEKKQVIGAGTLYLYLPKSHSLHRYDNSNVIAPQMTEQINLQHHKGYES